MGNFLGITCLTINCAEITLFGKSGSCTCLRRTSFPSLQKDLRQLRAATKDVTDKIELEERKDLTRIESVSQWLQQVETIQTHFDKLQTDFDKLPANKCFCPANFKTSYSFGKKVANVRKEVVSLLESKPEVVTRKTLIPTAKPIPVEEIIGMHSVFDHVWKFIKDQKVGIIIGLHGMGGVGKTTLMTHLHNKLCKSTHTFDAVLWIVISSTPNLQTVQNDIGKKLGFDSDEWKDKSQHDKATDIYNFMTQKKYVLFFDDVWQGFDLIKLGVPRPDQTNTFKVVLTTRSREVCGNMEVNQTIQVTCLKEEEAWNLFQKKVGENIINAHPGILEIEKLVAKECDGLPLALIVIGRTMASKTTPRAWNTALNRLKKYTSEFTGMQDHIWLLLKFSYDNLPNLAIKSCFLYCSLYPEDYLIRKEDIIDKWICEGFLDECVDLHEARNEGYEYLDTLVNASLLEESKDTEEFKMHDIIREMAIWTSCECGEKQNKFFVRAGVGLRETPKVAEFEGSERVSLMENEMDELIGKPNCPNLLTLFLNASYLKRIDNEFFQSMPNLRVLDLSDNGHLEEIPDEVFNLVNLQYLNLTSMDISKLAVNNLGKLINLKWLRITLRTQLPNGVLSSLKKLQVLHFSNSNQSDIPLPESFVEEIEGLVHLNDLRIYICNDFDLSRFSSSHKMASITTKLEVYNLSSTRKLDMLFSHKTANLKSLRIIECEEIEYFICSGESNYNNNYFQSLNYLFIFSCPKLKDITALAFAPNLEKIQIRYCVGMKELCGEWRPFPKLKHLELWVLPELERIMRYPNAAAKLPLFLCLTYMRIYNCPKLKKLPFNSSSTGIIIKGSEEWWNGLEWEDDATRIACLPSFITGEIEARIHKNLLC